MASGLENIETIESPFRRFVTTIGVFPTAFTDAMTYYECLAYLVKYLEDTVVPAVNENAEALEELQNYVAHYFDNLDVQEEINNKLDSMAQDGSLTNLIGAYCQPLIDAQNTEITNFKSDVNASISDIRSEVQAVTSGSPLVATSTDEMTDTTRVYVNTTDGNWYYYDGDSWEVGGTYQSSGIADGSINYMMVDEITSTLYNSAVPTYTETEGSYIANNGNITVNAGYKYTSNIELKAGQTIIIYTNATSGCAVIARYVTDHYITLVLGTGSAQYYSYTAREDMYVALSGVKNTFNHVKILTTTDKVLVKDYNSAILITKSWTSGKYISYNSGSEVNNVTYSVTDFIPVCEGMKLHLTDPRNITGSASSDGLAYYDSNKTYVSGEQYQVVTDVTYTVPAGISYVRLSKVTAHNLDCICENYITILLNAIKSIQPESVKYIDMSIYPKVGVVGDSYAIGSYGQDSSATTDTMHPTMSWPAMLERKYGFKLTNYSLSGMSTRSFISSSTGLSKLMADDPTDIYLLVLERNDYNIEDRGETGYLGSLTDITSHSLGNYPDTFYGNYATIIESIMQHAPNAKIVMISGDYLSSNVLGTAYNNAMSVIAEHYNIPYVAELDDNYFYSSLYRNNRPAGGHPGAVQYNGMSTALDRLISQCIANNPTYFKYNIPA